MYIFEHRGWYNHYIAWRNFHYFIMRLLKKNSGQVGCSNSLWLLRYREITEFDTPNFRSNGALGPISADVKFPRFCRENVCGSLLYRSPIEEDSWPSQWVYFAFVGWLWPTSRFYWFQFPDRREEWLFVYLSFKNNSNWFIPQLWLRSSSNTCQWNCWTKWIGLDRSLWLESVLLN